jgi:hypothetical protein
VPLVLHVWLPLPVPGLDYLAPHDPPPDGEVPDPRDAGSDLLGRRLAVPWQGGLRVGWVAALRPARPAETLDLRPAIAWVAGGPLASHPPRAPCCAAQAERCAVPSA